MPRADRSVEPPSPSCSVSRILRAATSSSERRSLGAHTRSRGYLSPLWYVARESERSLLHAVERLPRSSALQAGFNVSAEARRCYGGDAGYLGARAPGGYSGSLRYQGQALNRGSAFADQPLNHHEAATEVHDLAERSDRCETCLACIRSVVLAPSVTAETLVTCERALRAVTADRRVFDVGRQIAAARSPTSL